MFKKGVRGDSISIAYTPFVRDILGDDYFVMRPMAEANRAENCEGTTKGVEAINR